MADASKSEVNLFVSYSHETHYRFSAAEFPFHSLKDFSYSILDDSES